MKKSDNRFIPPDCAHCKSKDNSLFHFCHTGELSEIEDAKTCSIYKKNQPLFLENSRPLGLFCINSGKIKLHKYAADGRDQIMRIAGPGEFVGYSSLLGNTPYNISATALEDSTVCLVPKAHVFQLFNDNSRFKEGLVQLLCSTIDHSVNKMSDIAYKPVRSRMAEALLILKEAYSDDDNPSGKIHINREDLASLVGTVKETAIRTLKDFKECNYIETQRSDIIVKDTSGLLKVAELSD